MRNRNDKRKRKKIAGQVLNEEDITVVDTDVVKRSVVATGIGNAMEWFDFGIYAYLATTIGAVFFPDFSGPTQLVFSFATFAVAFLVRPLGGIFFGMLGDKLGRKRILAITLIMMALATLSIGFIPGYGSIGIMAPILLLVARLVQGFSTGGEYSGAMTFLAESSPDKRRSFLTSGLEVGTLCGYIFGSGTVTLLTYILGQDTMLAWGWRIPFFIAAPIGLIGLYFRTKLEETPAFKKKMDAESSNHISMKDIIVNHKAPLLKGLIIVFFYNVIYYTVLTYMPSHLNSVLGYSQTTGLLIILVVMCIQLPIVLLMGFLGDRFGKNRIILGGLIGMLLLAIPSYMLIGSGTTVWIFTGIMILALLFTTFQGTLPSLLPSLFFTEVRYSGLSITYNISVSLFGGTAPLLVSWLISWTGSQFIPAYYIMFASLVGVVVMTVFVKETSGKPLRGSPPAVADKSEIPDVLEENDDGLWWNEEKGKFNMEVATKDELYMDMDDDGLTIDHGDNGKRTDTENNDEP
ncbi:MFS transporter [Virgibacillus oceani]|uniref:Putative proline/betaine transporter n=1 Tax=Virgibacillus oceani TaxID=1479511 RepID=A0A917M5P6_9BACI|nr:MFS transporter [Virgibacillus oceani]GGG78872.1 MFS transporter [Virgibacillus oceani]